MISIKNANQSTNKILTHCNVGIIGGGASGMICAAVLDNSGMKTVVFERGDKPLRKVLASGNGRCNYTNLNMDCTNFHSRNLNNTFVKEVLDKFNEEHTLDFFSGKGIVPVFEEGRVYPRSGQAASIVDTLKDFTHNTEIIYSCEITNVQYYEGKFILTSNLGVFSCDKLVVATGGYASPDLGGCGLGYKILEDFGHTIQKTSPALVQLITDGDVINGLSGVRAYVEISHKFKKYKGEILFTNYGISGIVVMDLSYCAESGDVLGVDFYPEMETDELYDFILNRRNQLSHVSIDNFLSGMLNKKLAKRLVTVAGKKLNLPSGELSENDISKIAYYIKNYQINVMDNTGYKNAQATFGGADLSQFNPESMESMLVKGLYATGEVLDVLGDCGGYNLQWAWTTGYIAGDDIKNKYKGTNGC